VKYRGVRFHQGSIPTATNFGVKIDNDTALIRAGRIKRASEGKRKERYRKVEKQLG
jgi:hypothetical protein